MWVWSSDAVSFFLSKKVNNWSEPPGSLQLLALFDTKKESASEDQTHMRKWIILYNYSAVMWVWSPDAPSFFVSKTANNWRQSNRSLQLLALFDKTDESAVEDQTPNRKWIIVYNYSVALRVWYSDELSFFVPKRAHNWRQRFDSFPLLAFFDTKTESASEDQTHNTTE
jgi:hypothetical protein